MEITQVTALGQRLDTVDADTIAVVSSLGHRTQLNDSAELLFVKNLPQ